MLAVSLINIFYLAQGGVYLLTLWDTFAGAPLLFVVLTQSIGVAWFYGKRLEFKILNFISQGTNVEVLVESIFVSYLSQII